MKKLLLFCFLCVSIPAFSQIKKRKIIQQSPDKEQGMPAKGYWVTSKIVGIPYKDGDSTVRYFIGYIVKYLPGSSDLEEEIPDDYFLDRNKKRVDVVLVDYCEIKWK